MKRPNERTPAIRNQARADTAAKNFNLADESNRRMESTVDKSTQALQRSLQTRQAEIDNALAELEAAAKLPKAPTTCTAVKTDGERCKAQTLAGSDFCFFHHPGKSSERREARRKGGLARSRKVICLPPGAATWQLETTGGVHDLLGMIATQVLQGRLDPKIANSVAYICSVALRAQVVENTAM